MSQPTVLNPWYVVQRQDRYKRMTYYVSAEGPEEQGTFSLTKIHAMLFTNLQSAARVAMAEDAEVRVLMCVNDYNEFGG